MQLQNTVNTRPAALQQIVTADRTDWDSASIVFQCVLWALPVVLLCWGAQSHCWKPQWKRSIVHIPAT